MAARFWVGGTGNWDASTTTHWAATSGGAGGASVPTSSDTVTFDANSNATAYTMTVTTAVVCSNISIGAPASGKIIMGVGTGNVSKITISGNFSIPAGTNLDTSTTQVGLFFVGIGAQTITNNGCVQNWFDYIFTAGVGTYQLQDDFIGSDNIQLQINSGTFDANNHNVTCGDVSNFGSTILMGSGTWTITDIEWSIGTAATINCGTSTVVMNEDGMIFIGGGHTYNNLIFAGGSGTVGFQIGTNGSTDIFNNITDTGTAAHPLKFHVGSTTVVDTFTVSGSSGNTVTITSSTTGTHTLTKAGGGVISCDWLNIQHSIATPANTWYAGTNSVNNQGVTTAGLGWIFTAPPVNNGNFLAFM